MKRQGRVILRELSLLLPSPLAVVWHLYENVEWAEASIWFDMYVTYPALYRNRRSRPCRPWSIWCPLRLLGLARNRQQKAIAGGCDSGLHAVSGQWAHHEYIHGLSNNGKLPSRGMSDMSYSITLKPFNSSRLQRGEASDSQLWWQKQNKLQKEIQSLFVRRSGGSEFFYFVRINVVSYH